MTQSDKKTWGQEIGLFSVNPTSIHLARRLLLTNGANTMRNEYEQTDYINSEEFIVDENNNVFQKKIADKNSAKQAEFFEALLAVPGQPLSPDGKYVRFVYRPYKEQGVFENVFFRDFENGEVVSCTQFSDEDILEILKEEPNHQLIQIMNMAIEAFNNLEKSRPTGSNKQKS